MRVKLSLMGDMCMPQPLMLSAHDWPCFEMPTPVMWMPGFALQQNKLTKTVFHESQFMALEGHDCGHWIIHIWCPPLPPLTTAVKLPLIITKSKRKVMFSSSTVKANDSQIACAQLIGLPPLPMLSCGSPVSIPNSFPVFNFLHSVSVNMTVGDLIAGFIGIALDMACEALLKSKWLSQDAKWLGKANWLGKNLKEPFKNFLGANNLLQFGAKLVFGLASNAARLVLTGEGNFKIQVFPNLPGVKSATVGVEVKRDGRKRFVLQSQSSTNEGTKEEKRVFTWKDGHLTSDERSTTFATDVRIESATQRTNYGEDGQIQSTDTSTVWSGGSVSSPLGSPTARSSVTTFQVSKSVPAQGPATSTSGGFQGTSTADGSWGQAL